LRAVTDSYRAQSYGFWPQENQRLPSSAPRVTVRYGVKVTGLLTAPGRGGGRPPHVTGVRTDRGDLTADLVIDATGRRSPVDDWLRQIGARAAATWRAECGIAYFSRHYRVRPGVGLPAPLVTRIVVALDEFPAGKWGGDNGAVQLPMEYQLLFDALVLAGLSDSEALRWLDGVRRTGLERRFTTRTIAAYQRWADLENLAPLDPPPL